MENILVVAGMILVSGLVAIEIGVAAAILEIIAGIVMGNFLSFESFETLEILADFGLLAIMYFAGLEIDTDILRRNMKSSLEIGTISFAVPFAAIGLISYYLMHFSQASSILIAITLSATSIPLVYSVLASSGKLNDENKKILSAAMVVDVFSMMALSIIASDITRYTIYFLVVLILFSLFVSNLGKRIFRYYKGNACELEFKIIMFIILSIGLISELAGIEAVLLAFGAGVVTSAFVVEHEMLWDKLRSITFGFLAPIFFFKVGTTVSVHTLIDNIGLITVFFFIAFTVKYYSTYMTAKKHIPKRSRFIGLLFNTPLSIGIVAATIGLQSGIFTAELYSTMIGVVILLSIVASFAVGTSGE